MKKIIIYTSNTCIKCKQLKKLLNDNNINYIENNIDTDFKHKAFLLAQNITTIPTVIIGKCIIIVMDVNEAFKLIKKSL